MGFSGKGLHDDFLNEIKSLKFCGGSTSHRYADASGLILITFLSKRKALNYSVFNELASNMINNPL